MTPTESIQADLQSDSTWKINRNYPGDHEKIQLLIESLQQTVIQDAFADSLADNSEYGLDQPRYSLEINRNMLIRTGRNHPIKQGVYTSRNDSVFLVDPTFLNFVPITEVDFVSHHYQRIPIESIQNLTLITLHSAPEFYRDSASLWREGKYRLKPEPIQRMVTFLSEMEILSDSILPIQKETAGFRLIINHTDTISFSRNMIWSNFNSYPSPISSNWREDIPWDYLDIRDDRLTTWQKNRISRIIFQKDEKRINFQRDSTMQWTGSDFAVIEKIITQWSDIPVSIAELSQQEYLNLENTPLEARIEFGMDSNQSAVIQLHQYHQRWIARNTLDEYYFIIPDSFITTMIPLSSKSGVTE